MRRAVAGSAVSPSLRDTLLLRERALQATTVGVVISDLRLPDNPVVWVNAAFTTTTGYSAEQAIGRNCRFLQGPSSDPDAVAEMRSAVKEQRASMVTLLNYRADGSTFWNSVSTAPVCDADGDVIGFIGIQVDVTDQVLAQQEREAQLRAELPAGPPDAVQPDATLAMLARVNEALGSGDVNAMLAALAAQLVPAFADNCAIDLIPTEGPAAGDVGQLHRVAAASTRRPEAEVGDPVLLARVIRTARPISVVDHLAAPSVGAGRQTEQGFDAEGLLAVPLQGRSGVLGALTLVSAVRSRRYTDVHLALALDIGRRAGFVIESARLLEAEQEAADALRLTLNPVLPAIDGLQLASPGDPGAWRDVWSSSSGVTWIAAGALTGEGVAAPVRELAAAMDVHRAVRSRAAASDDPAAAGHGLPRVWVGRLTRDGLLAYAGEGFSACVRRASAEVDDLSGSGQVTLAVDDALELCRKMTPAPARPGQSPASAPALLVVRRRASMGA